MSNEPADEVTKDPVEMVDSDRDKPDRHESKKEDDLKEQEDATNSFKIPKRLLVESKPNDDTFRLPPPSSSPEPSNLSSSPKLNKNIITNLNKSLKAKQKIISSKEPLPKNSTIITEIINRSPTSSTFPNSITLPTNNSSSNISNTSALSTPDISENIPNLPITPSINTSKDANAKTKRVSKQNSTRTDFFAAKLASAVDDVDSSDSDETFVYENNMNEEFENNADSTESQQGEDPTAHASDADSVYNSPENSNNNTLTANANEPVSDNEPGPEPPKSAPVEPEASSGSAAQNKSNPVNTKPMLNPSVNSSYGSSNQFLDNLLRSNLRPPNARASSTPSFNVHDQQSTPTALKSLGIQGSSSPVSHMVNNSSGLNSLRNNNFNATNSIHDYNEDKYSFNQVEDEDDVDEVSSHDSFNSQRNLVSSSNTTFPKHQQTHQDSTKSRDLRANIEPTPSIASKSTSKKKSTASSKLRSTTSKLFDKKGSQPRRYSIIPDDIDIEDFDDELIYYDNNIRFPYNNPSNNNSQNLNYNESSPLIANNSRIPHYRSLNLGLQANKKANKGKRYVSTGHPFLTNPASPASPNNLNTDIFPFPYPENQNQNQEPSNYFYGFDEYDEEAGSLHDGMQLQFDNPSRKTSGRFNNSRLSPSQGHFLLPRKRSIHSNYSYLKRTIYTLISIIGILTIGFIMGFVLATTKDLSNVQISQIDHPLVSQDELVFNIVVEALNPGWFTIDIEEVELDIFAKSGYLPVTADEVSLDSKSTVETVLLGSVYNLESAISFPGGFFNRQIVSQMGEIKLLSPGKNLTNFMTKDDNSTDPDNSSKWEIILKNPFDLVVRGILKYNLPLSKSVKSVVVTKTSFIDPTVNDD